MIGHSLLDCFISLPLLSALQSNTGRALPFVTSNRETSSAASLGQAWP